MEINKKTSQNDVCQKNSSLQANTVEESGQYNDSKNGIRHSEYSAVKLNLRLTTLGEKYRCIYYTYIVQRSISHVTPSHALVHSLFSHILYIYADVQVFGRIILSDFIARGTLTRLYDIVY